VAELLDAGAALRASPGDRGAIEAERHAVEQVLAEAEKALSSPTAAVVDRMRDTLHAAAGDEEVAARLREGRLVEDHRAVGLGPWTGAGGAAQAAAGKGSRGKDSPPRAAETRRTAATKEGGARTKSATEARSRPAKRRPDAAARKRLQAAQREADKARRDLAAAERDRERAEVAFRSADRAHAEAAERSRKADARLEELRSGA
jgi:hypothetical protein